MLNIKLRALFTLAFILVFAGCSQDSLDRYVLNIEPVDKTPIKQKHYDKPPLSMNELDTLFQMATYSGSPAEYGDLVMRSRTEGRGVDPVIFSHRIHRAKYTCRVCHVELEFSMKKGMSGITREDYLDGRFCGACHDGRIAFSVEYGCNLCHIKDGKRTKSFTESIYASLAEILPKLPYGDGIDWMASMNQGLITPKDTIYEDNPGSTMALPTHLEKPLRWYTNVPGIYVSFPHTSHTAWLDCSNCHPDIFEIKNTGTVSFDKEKNLYGLYCGTCHMTVAFPMNGCSRCHPGQSDRF